MHQSLGPQEFITTLPPGLGQAASLAFAQRAFKGGATRLELRTDLHALESLDLRALHQALPLLVSQRTSSPLPPLPAGAWRDVPLGEAAASEIVSHHASQPMQPHDAVELWKRAGIPAHAHLKHVEPLGGLEDAARLLLTQQLLNATFGAARVTVLATGEAALPWRCVLAERNALDYVALSSDFMAAPGQRLLLDAARSGRQGGPRLGILGSHIPHSRSPRIHPQPFDRLDLPDATPMGPLLHALHPHYRGFAVTSPFKRAVALAVGSSLPAVNTLVRTSTGWNAFNSDVAGARLLLERLPSGPLTVLGNGGVADALRLVDASRVQCVTRDVVTSPVRTPAVWTWPAHVEPPETLRFDGGPVAVVAYGPAAWRIAGLIRASGGTPWMLGPAWFVAQAREQQRLWMEAA